MKTFNKIILMGNLVSQPEAKITSSGKTVTSFALATNDIFMNDNRKVQQIDFHRIIAWQHLGEICQKYLQKGSSVFLEGKLKNRSYLNNKGEKKFITEIVAQNISILTSPYNEGETSNGQSRKDIV